MLLGMLQSISFTSYFKLLGILSLVLSWPSFAAEGEIFLSQRVAYMTSEGKLSKNKNHIGYMSSVARSFSGSANFLSLDLIQRIGFLSETFYALDKEKLWFPLVPDSKIRILEPSIEFDVCLFSKSILRLCGGGGISAARVQSSSQDFQTYASYPFEARVLYKSSNGAFLMEAGFRKRVFENRMEGFLAQHSDVMGFVGLGVSYTLTFARKPR